MLKQLLREQSKLSANCKSNTIKLPSKVVHRKLHMNMGYFWSRQDLQIGKEKASTGPGWEKRNIILLVNYAHISDKSKSRLSVFGEIKLSGGFEYMINNRPFRPVQPSVSN